MLPGIGLVTFAGLVVALTSLGVTGCGPSGDRTSAKPGSETASPAETRPGRPHLLFVMIDTLRADHLGVYGYGRPTSPFIDKLAERGVTFVNAYSVAPWTNPAIAAFFTGYHPQAVFPPALHREAIHQALPSGLSTLAEQLRSEGYHTIGLVDHPGISPKLGYDRGFDVYLLLYEEGGFDMWSTTETSFVLQTVMKQLDDFASLVETDDREPRFFIYLHLVYPHRPYTPAPQYAEMFGPGFENIRPEERRGVINRYDGEIRQTDDLLAAIAAELETRSLLDETAILITSDHGEAFWEHGFEEHGKMFYDEAIKIPLVLIPAGGRSDEPARVRTPVSNIDVFPTLLDLAGAPLPAGIGGKSLLRYLRADGQPQQGDWLFSESPHSFDVNAAAVISPDNVKFSSYRRDDRTKRMIFDLAKDPGEMRNLAEAGRSPKPFIRRLEEHREATRLLRQRPTEQVEPLDQETLDRLEALGYTEEATSD